MSLSSEKEEIAGLIDRLCDAMSTMITSKTGRYGVELRHKIGELRSFYAIWWEEETFMTHLLDCFTTAKNAPVTLEALTVVRQAMFGESPTDGSISDQIVQAAITFCLSTESQLLIDTEFKSRDDVENMIKRMRTAFDTARERAADKSDSTNYQALTALAGSVISHLADSARPLPRMLTFQLKNTLPALTVSQMIYHAADRWEEIIDENKTFHPLFVQREIKGLSQ